jgi:hypothetical protein
MHNKKYQILCYEKKLVLRLVLAEKLYFNCVFSKYSLRLFGFRCIYPTEPLTNIEIIVLYSVQRDAWGSSCYRLYMYIVMIVMICIRTQFKGIKIIPGIQFKHIKVAWIQFNIIQQYECNNTRLFGQISCNSCIHVYFSLVISTN